MPVSGVERVDVPLSVKAVQSVAASDHVLTGPTPHHVVSVAPVDRVSAATTLEAVRLGIAENYVGEGRADDVFNPGEELRALPAGEERDAYVDTSGRVENFRIISGRDDEEVKAQLNRALLFTIFVPAQSFGRPVPGKAIMSFSHINVKG